MVQWYLVLGDAAVGFPLYLHGAGLVVRILKGTELSQVGFVALHENLGHRSEGLSRTVAFGFVVD